MKKIVIVSVLSISLAAACLQGCGSLTEGISLPWSSGTSQETPVPTPEITETPVPTPEVTETPAPTPEVTETPVPTPEATETPAPTPEAVDEPAMYAAYLADLRSRQDTVLGYNWQMSDGESHYPPGSDPNALKPAALVDIWGGVQPELIYLYASNPGGTADLRIVGWENGVLKELCVFPNWDANAASGTRYALFRIRGEKTLYAYSYIGDELGYYSWYRFREQDGVLTAEKAASAEVSWTDYSDTDFRDAYTIDGQPVDQDAYESFENDLIEKAETTVIFSGRPESDTFLGTLYRKPLAALGYEEILRRLHALAGIPEPEPEAEITPAPEAAATPAPTAAPTAPPIAALTVAPASNTPVPSGGEIFPDSSSRQLTESDLDPLSPDQLQTAVNEIYACHGYAFQTPEVRAYFESFDWYSPDNPDMAAVASQFSDVEQANMALLSSRL